MEIAGLVLGALGLILLLTGSYYFTIICGLIGAVLSAKRVQAVQEEGESAGLAYLGVALSVAALIFGAIANFWSGCVNA